MICSDILAENWSVRKIYGMISSFQKLLAERYLLRTFNRTICSSETARWPFYVPKIPKISNDIPCKIVRDYFSRVANLLADVLVKKYVAVRQGRTEIRRTVWLSGTHISPKIIVWWPCDFAFIRCLLSQPIINLFIFLIFANAVLESDIDTIKMQNYSSETEKISTRAPLITIYKEYSTIYFRLTFTLVWLFVWKQRLCWII